MNHYLIKENMDSVALISGGARRIGAMISQILHRAGYNIIVHYHRSHQEAHDLVESLNQIRNGSAMALSADLNQFSAYSDLIHQATEVWGRLDILINNASSFYPTEVGKTSDADWNDLINTNLKGPYFLAQSASEYLKIHQGCIINLADIHGERPLKNYSVYSIAKAGLIMMTKTLARELGPQIRVNAVAPGITLLPEKQYDMEKIAELKSRTILKRFATPEDIAQAVLFLIQQTAVTGQILKVDCGRSLYQ